MAIVVLDACRDYPFGPLADAFGDGLANVATSGETLVAYATAAGQVAQDGTGPNSPYTSALITALELPGRDIYDVFRTVRAKVREAFGQQIPWITAPSNGPRAARSKVRAASPPRRTASLPDPGRVTATYGMPSPPAIPATSALRGGVSANRLAALARGASSSSCRRGADPALSVDTECCLRRPVARS
jgi:uncharacterized caspase-like protein